MAPEQEDTSAISPMAIKNALWRIMDNRRFSRATMQRKFLDFIVDQELAGHGSRISESQIAIDVYGRDESYDPQLDRGIAVAAGNIRRKLSEYYQEEGVNDPIRIDIPLGAYRPVFSETGKSRLPEKELENTPEYLPPLAFSPTIAVLPFRNLGESIEYDSFTQGFSASLSTAMTRFDVFRVIAEQSTVHYQGKHMDVRIVGRELGARFILLGTIQRSNNDIRITVALSDVADGTQLWAETFDRDLTSTGIFQLQDEVTQTVVATISDANGIAVKSLSPSPGAPPARDLATHEAIWLFLQYLNHADLEDFHIAKSALQDAVDREPDCALAWAGLAMLYSIDYMRGITLEEDLQDAAWRLANHAVSLNSKSGNVRLARAQAAFVRRKSNIVIIEAEKAISLNQNSPTLGGIAGLLIGYAGQLDRGVKIVEGMKQLNPHFPSWMLSLTCFSDYMKGNYEAALADAELVTLNKWPDKSLYHAMVLGQLGRKEEAALQLDQLGEIEPDFSRDPANYVYRMFLFDNQINKVMDGLRKAGL